MSGSNSFVFSAKRRGSNTPVVCKFFAEQDSFRREMKFFERIHTGDFVPGESFMHITHARSPSPAVCRATDPQAVHSVLTSLSASILLRNTSH